MNSIIFAPLLHLLPRHPHVQVTLIADQYVDCVGGLGLGEGHPIVDSIFERGLTELRG